MTLPLGLYTMIYLPQALALWLCLGRAALLRDAITVAALLAGSGLLTAAFLSGGGAPGVFALILSALAFGTAASFGLTRLATLGVPRAAAALLLALLPILAVEAVLRLPI